MDYVSLSLSALGKITALANITSFFIGCLVVTFTTLGYLFNTPDRVADTGYFSLLPEYDFIIIGGGTAGSVVANRLSEVPSWKVLLIEAGMDETVISDIPLLASQLQLTNMDWQYKAEPQQGACLAMNGGRCSMPRGKVLGGSSTINFMIYLRGNKKDFDGWSAMGNSGWSYDEVLQYFKKSEDNTNPDYASSPYHGTGGYMTISDPPYKTPLADAFVQAGVDMGYPETDNNGATQTGFNILQGAMRHGSRCSNAKAFLRPARNRPNLHIAMNAMALKININQLTKRAESVLVLKDGLPKIIKAKREIILSAGAINSPQLLMISGVGPKSDLQQLGIPCIKDSSVGKNLQDHMAMGGLTFLINDTVSMVQSRVTNFKNFLDYAVNGSGVLTIKGGVEAVGFINTKYADPSGDYPDMELHFQPGSPASVAGSQMPQGLNDSFYDTVFTPILFRDTWSVAPMLLRPKSRGVIKITSSSAFVKPLIYPNYFTDPQDIQVIREGVKFVLLLANTTTMQKFGSRVHDIPYPGCAHLTFMSDSYIECAIRQDTLTIFHYAGTCKMGPPSDPEAVVDPTLKVHGITGLRVIDASIMPNIVSANTNAAITMIAEKGSDLIKTAYNISIASFS